MKADTVSATLPIADLEPYPGNPRKRQNVDDLKDSLKRFGQYRAIVVQKSRMRILAGHHVAKAALELGWTDINVELIDCDDTEARAIVLADNRLSDLAGYERVSLAELLEAAERDERGLLGTGYLEKDVRKLLRSQRRGDHATPDERSGTSEVTVELGDRWRLGRHWLLCDDATNPAVWESIHSALDGPAVLITDPPYGMNLDTDYFTQHAGGTHDSGVYRPVIGDDRPFDPRPILKLCDEHYIVEQLWFGADYYRQAMPDGGSWLVWDKRTDDGVFDDVFGAHFELIWSSTQRKRRILRHLWTGHQGLQAEDTRKRIHPTQKPVTLLEEILDLYVDLETWLIDCYAGSGSLLIAAENLGYRSVSVELDPVYAGIIIDRWQARTGLTAERSNHARPR